MGNAEDLGLALVGDPTTIDDIDVLLNNWAEQLATAIVNFAALNPTGTIKVWPRSTPPVGHLVCNGAAISRETYADLFAVIGTSFGDGDGSTTFELPNLKGKVPVGLNSSDADIDTIGKTGGEKTHTMLDTELAPHRHNYGGDDAIGIEFGYAKRSNVPYDAQSGIFADGNGGNFWTAGTYREASPYPLIAAAEPANNMQPFVTTHYIIKT